MARFEVEKKEENKRLDKIRNEREERKLQGYPPDKRKRLEEFTKAMDAEAYKTMSRYANPCQPMAPRLVP